MVSLNLRPADKTLSRVGGGVLHQWIKKLATIAGPLKDSPAIAGIFVVDFRCGHHNSRYHNSSIFYQLM